MSRKSKALRQQQKNARSNGGGNFGIPNTPNGKANGGGWGIGSPNAKPAGGHNVAVNPFMTPKAAGINITSQTFPSNYYVEWNIETWRAACDQTIKMGYTMAYGTLTSWAFESSPFVQSLFRAVESAVGRIPLFISDAKGNQIQTLTNEICEQPWNIQMKKEIALALFWGFTGLNFDPFSGKTYKYPMQDLDPINRMLKASTYDFFDGTNFDESANLLFIQPSTNYERFLGWMQPITRSYIEMNLSSSNWLAAGRKLAFPLLAFGYPQGDGAIDPASGLEINPYRIEAENLAANVDTQNALVFPYTKDSHGNIQKSIEIEYEKPGTGANQHKVFQEFNADRKSEIREMILGGNMTSESSKGGSRALGEVQERKWEAVVGDIVEYVLSVYNGDFLPNKISKFYKNFPDCKVDYNRTKQWELTEIVQISNVMFQNGKRLTDSFFEASGISKDFFEDSPTPTGQPKLEESETFMAGPKESTFLGVKKKY